MTIGTLSDKFESNNDSIYRRSMVKLFVTD